MSGDEIKRISAECVHRSGFDDACVFMCGTRGLYRSGGVLGDPRDCDNGFYAYAVPYYYVVPRGPSKPVPISGSPKPGARRTWRSTRR